MSAHASSSLNSYIDVNKIMNFYQFSGSQINMSSGSGFGSPVGGDIGAQIRQTIEKLKNNVTETNGELDRCKQDQEAFSVEYYSFREQNQRYEAMLQQVLYDHSSEIRGLRST